MGESDDCVFCKIVAGQIPCYKVFETEELIAFLDIGPLSAGHTLLLPKKHYAAMNELPGSMAASLGQALPQLAGAVQTISKAEGVNILQNNGRCAGQEVDHVHIHIIPRFDGDGLGFRWKPTSYDEGQAEEICSRFAKIIGK